MDLIRENVDAASEAETRSVWRMKPKKFNFLALKLSRSSTWSVWPKTSTSQAANFRCIPQLT